MSGGFLDVRFFAAEHAEDDLRPLGVSRATRGAAKASPKQRMLSRFNSDEAAARFYADQVLGRDTRAVVRGLTAPSRAQAVPDLRLSAVREVPQTKTRLVRFEQTCASIPVFGTHLVVELDPKRGLVNLGGKVADIGKVSTTPSLSAAEALRSIAALTKTEPEALASAQAPELTFFHDEEEDEWHLTYLFTKVPATPPGFVESATRGRHGGHGLGRSPRDMHPRLNYLVDAHDGSVVFYYSAAPMLGIPTECHGNDELGCTGTFWGQKDPGGFEMSDPLRAIRTFDLKLCEIKPTSPPSAPVHCAEADWSGSNPAAVSAHVNATRVYDFYKSVLLRDGIDDKGMDLLSVVNCTYSSDENPPVWHNAFWSDDHMWYGQDRDEKGTLHSYSRFLDVIAHELTHGVTEHTSNLVYEGQSGALNESFSDIFGVIIANWYQVGADSDVGKWSWEIGAGLGERGLPLRDMSDPTRTGDPDHMSKFLKTTSDSGGVHTNSNIHNKAAYLVLTAKDKAGKRVFTAREVATLYYLCLARLNSRVTFAEVLQTLVDVASVYWAGDAAVQKAKVQQIKDAYQKVGIV